ncbi:hypothetical protein HDU98_010051 [Podochytrium sp. JEL0797]|nr:hypothetical protein HDU98_010051 [Podochytrium sp. JEL0797]
MEHLRDLDPIVLLDSFLTDIKSGDPTGPITATALNNRKFEATDAVSDVFVLTRILRLTRVTVLNDARLRALDDKAICEMVEDAFGWCFYELK